MSLPPDVPAEHAPRRKTCTTCLKPRSVCICQWVRPVAHETEVLILQHPLEVHHAKNTARLLHMSLENSTLLVGESFDERHLSAGGSASSYTVLLYPQTHEPAHAGPALVDLPRLLDTRHLRLLVLDATWRKSRKMLHLSPALAQLPRMSLTDVAPSGYLIRKAHQPGQLSTLEATCAALVQLENRPEQVQPLLESFEGFVAQRMDFKARAMERAVRCLPAS